MKFLKVVFSIFPKWYWITIISAILFRFLEDEYVILSNFLINFVAVLTFIRIGILLHETGHLISAILVKGKPRRLVLGNGYEVQRFVLFGIKIIINTSFRSGFVFASFENHKFLKFRYLLYVAGGSITNLLLAYYFYKVFNFNTDTFFGKYGIDLASGFIFANAFLAVTALIPFRINYLGMSISNDGLKILQLLFKKRKRIISSINTSELLDAYDYYEDRKYDKAMQIYEKYLEEEDGEQNIPVQINLSVVYLKKGMFNESLQLLGNIEKLLKTDKKVQNYKALVYNNLAWLYLIQQNIEQADKYSKAAFEIRPSEQVIQSTRGSVLIEKGEIETGINHLLHLVDFKYINNQVLAAAIYLSYGYYLKKNTKEEKKYTEFVLNNLSLLDDDDLQIWYNINKRKLYKSN